MNAIMAREIALQAEAVRRALPSLRASAAELDLPARRVFIAGCGDSAFAPIALSGLFAEASVKVVPVTAMDLACYRVLGPEDLCVLVSISGETRRTLQAAAGATLAGARTIAVTRDAASTLAAACDRRLIMPYTPLSRSTPHTLDYAMTLAALAALAERTVTPGKVRLDALPATIDRALDAAEPVVRAAAAGMTERSKIIVLGAGPGLGTAAYAAAKFHEAGGLVALAAELENFAHGMNFMLQSGDLVVVLATNEPARRRALALIEGLHALTGGVLAVGLPAVEAKPAHALDLKDLKDWHAEVAATMVVQRLCLAVVERLGLDVEQPRAGRSNGQMHIDIQKNWMASVPTTTK